VGAADAMETVSEVEQSMDPCPFIVRRGYRAFCKMILHVLVSETLVIVVAFS
jgi:hypothetical protein